MHGSSPTLSHQQVDDLSLSLGHLRVSSCLFVPTIISIHNPHPIVNTNIDIGGNFVYTVLMERQRGRPKKDPDDLSVFKTVRFPKRLWDELETVAPRGKRSAVIHEGLRRELARLRKRASA